MSFNIVILSLLKGTLAVATGAIAMKFAMFGLNAAFARSIDIAGATEAAKIVAFSFAWASVLHYSSARYIARHSILGNQAQAALTLRIAIALILASTPILALMDWTLAKDDIEWKVIVATIAIASGAALLDLSTSLANASGRNSLAALGQGLMGLAILITTIFILSGHSRMSMAVLLPIPLAAYVISAFILKEFKSEFEPIKKSSTRKYSLLNEARGLLFFSTPSVLGTIFINPLVLWAVNSVAGMSGPKFVVFIVCQNLLGLAMLLPGQLNTAAFSFLGRRGTTLKTGRIVLALSLGSSIASVVAIQLLLPYSKPIYGETFNQIRDASLWFTIAAIPFSISQVIATKMYLKGRPWADAFANMTFGTTFLIGCVLFADHTNGLNSLGILLATCYFLRLAVLATAYQLDLKKIASQPA